MNSRKITTVITKDYDTKDAENRPVIKVADRPTFILKTREGENRAVSPSQRNGAKYELLLILMLKKISCF
ncbi:GSCOCG00008764001-RA-CDS [Cotesia congregata]|nr:GSCOCG00008764001-RA-CDS [Cotesia congregata]